MELTWLTITSLKRPTRPVSWLTANTVAEANLAIKLLSSLSKLSLHGVRINSCEPSGLLIVDEDIEFIISKQKLKTVLLALNAKLAFSLALLRQNVMLACMSCAFQRQNVKLVFSLRLCQNAMSVSHFKNARTAFLK